MRPERAFGVRRCLGMFVICEPIIVMQTGRSDAPSSYVLSVVCDISQYEVSPSGFSLTRDGIPISNQPAVAQCLHLCFFLQLSVHSAVLGC